MLEQNIEPMSSSRQTKFESNSCLYWISVQDQTFVNKLQWNKLSFIGFFAPVTFDG